MKASFLGLTLVLLQMMNTTLNKPVVHLDPHHNNVPQTYGGKTLALLNAPPAIQLPFSPPKLDSTGTPWAIDIANLGPSSVTVTDGRNFRALINVGQTVHVHWNGTAYSLEQ